MLASVHPGQRSTGKLPRSGLTAFFAWSSPIYPPTVFLIFQYTSLVNSLGHPAAVRLLIHVSDLPNILLFIYLLVCLAICLSVYAPSPHIHPVIHSIGPSIHSSSCAPVHLLSQYPTCTSNSPSNLLVPTFMFSICICLSLYLSIRISSIQFANYLFIYHSLEACLSVYPPTHPFIHCVSATHSSKTPF